jgi:hypothetical protein
MRTQETLSTINYVLTLINIILAALWVMLKDQQGQQQVIGGTPVDDSGHPDQRYPVERCGKVTGSCRKTPEIAGTWKQYSDRKLSGFFPVGFCQIPVLSGRNRPGITRNRQFPDRVVRPGYIRFFCFGRNYYNFRLFNNTKPRRSVHQQPK